MYSSVTLVHKHLDNRTVTIEMLNEELIQLHVPAIVFVIVSMVIGVIGNSLVLYIYKNKFNRSNHRYFILFLAVIDMIACCVGLPYLIVSLRLPYLMTSVVTCKTIRYVHYFVNNSSGLLLVVISIERYMKICCPFKPNLTHRQTLYLCCTPLVISAIITIPAPIFFGANTIETGVYNLTGTQCYVDDIYKDLDPPYFEYFMGLLMIETAVSIVILGVLYTFIIRKLWKSDQFIEAMRSMQLKSTSNNGQKESSFSTDALNDATDSERDTRGTCSKVNSSASGDSSKPFLDKSDIKQSRNCNGNETNAMSEAVTDIDEKEFTRSHTDADKKASSLWRLSKELFKPNKNANGNRVKRAISDPSLNKKKNAGKFNTMTPTERLAYGNQRATNIPKPTETKSIPKFGNFRNSKTTARVTIMLFTVSLIFAIAFIPHLTLMIITFHDKTFVNSLSVVQVKVFQLFLRIFIVNNVANPVVYIFCDRKFRGHCLDIFKRVSCRGKQNNDS